MLRIKVELVPHGVESMSEVLDTIYVSNDGTGIPGGPNEGGVGNYEVHDNETLAHLHNVDYPSMYACGFIKGLERTPQHRLLLAEQALGVVQDWRKLVFEAEEHPDFDPARSARPKPPTRELGE